MKIKRLKNSYNNFKHKSRLYNNSNNKIINYNKIKDFLEVFGRTLIPQPTRIVYG